MTALFQNEEFNKNEKKQPAISDKQTLENEYILQRNQKVDLSHILLRKDKEINMIFQVIGNVSLNLLPFLAADFPHDDKTQYYQFYHKWNQIRVRVIKIMIHCICGEQNVLTYKEFIERCKSFPSFFDVLGVRNLAKTEIEEFEAK